MKYYDYKIKKVLSNEFYQGDYKIKRVYVMHNLKSKAEYKTCYQKGVDYFVVTDIYEVLYRDNKPIYKNKYEFYYAAKEHIDDIFTIKSMKIFMDSDKHYRTDWYDKKEKIICYRTIEGNNHKYENTKWSDGFYDNGIKYNGPLSDITLSEKVLSEALYLNDNYFVYENSCLEARI